MLKKVAAELISRHQEFAEMAEAEKMAVEKEKAENEKSVRRNGTKGRDCAGNVK